MTVKVVSASEYGLLPTSALQNDDVVNAEEEEESDVLTQPPQVQNGPDKTKGMTNNLKPKGAFKYPLYSDL